MCTVDRDMHTHMNTYMHATSMQRIVYNMDTHT
jgi:hypothetical protein